MFTHLFSISYVNVNDYCTSSKTSLIHFNEEHTAPSVHVSVQSIVGQDKHDQHEIAVNVVAVPPLIPFACLLLKLEIDLLFKFKFLMFLFFMILSFCC